MPLGNMLQAFYFMNKFTLVNNGHFKVVMLIVDETVRSSLDLIEETIDFFNFDFFYKVSDFKGLLSSH